GTVVAALTAQLDVGQLRLELARPEWTTPRLSLAAVLGVGLPLFVVTMASQNVPGVAVIRASGYPVPVSPVIGWTGVATLLLAPFGAFALNLAAITAAICMGPEAHADPARRYMAAVWAGIFYLLVGLFGATVAGLLPRSRRPWCWRSPASPWSAPSATARPPRCRRRTSARRRW